MQMWYHTPNWKDTHNKQKKDETCKMYFGLYSDTLFKIAYGFIHDCICRRKSKIINYKRQRQHQPKHQYLIRFHSNIKLQTFILSKLKKNSKIKMFKVVRDFISWKNTFKFEKRNKTMASSAISLTLIQHWIIALFLCEIT